MSCGTENTNRTAGCNHIEGCHTRTKAHCYGCGLQHCNEHRILVDWYNVGPQKLCWACIEDHERGTGQVAGRLAVLTALYAEAGYEEPPPSRVAQIEAEGIDEQIEARKRLQSLRRAERRNRVARQMREADEEWAADIRQLLRRQLGIPVGPVTVSRDSVGSMVLVSFNGKHVKQLEKQEGGDS